MSDGFHKGRKKNAYIAYIIQVVFHSFALLFDILYFSISFVFLLFCTLAAARPLPVTFHRGKSFFFKVLFSFKLLKFFSATVTLKKHHKFLME